MTRLQSAHAEYIAALQAERDFISAELERLGGAAPAAAARRPARPKHARKKKRAARKAAPKPKLVPPAAAPAPARTRPHQKFAGGGKKAKPGAEACPECGRTELHKSPGPGQRGRLVFHYAKPCELACKGGKLSAASDEDLKAGVHEKGACPKCDRVAFK